MDRTEFEPLALEHLDALYRGALRLTGSPEDAQDLVQEVYVRALRFHAQFQAGTNLKAWLFKILKNTYINQYRKNARNPEPLDLDDPAIGLAAAGNPHPASSTGPEAEVLKRLLAEDLEKALSSLPEIFRRVVILSDVEGFSYREIADIEGCPLGTVMSRLHRARRTLQGLLQKYAKNI
ncbi:MAG: sigma-70 family RNA polymerase sigma factor [Candidatus Tectomicrobia bacterium]|uniref:RNA polymerase sigma factor n=1 Tax=Tectimicrobiota bacterium TaxID=2528274 RepID=A0A932I0N5_UNCTE|nr:sigma-70 family RNA polymerase sigma factor [Candidatus Tectomicrobia bacterium]